MNERNGECITSIIVIFLLSSIFCSNAVADIGHHPPDPPESSGLGTEQVNISSYLKTVEVYLTAYDEVAYGNGSYILENPSNRSEELDLYFDPGEEAENVTIEVNHEPLSYSMRKLGRTESNFWSKMVASFPLDLSAREAVEINILWEMKTKTRDEDNIFWIIPYESVDIYWRFSYLIIATSSWNRNIENVNLTFDIRSDRFKDYEIEYWNRGSDDHLIYDEFSPSEIGTNEHGFDVIHFRFENFSKPSLYILITGDSEGSDHGIACCGGIIFSVVIIVLMLERVTSIKRKRQGHIPSGLIIPGHYPPLRPPSNPPL